MSTNMFLKKDFKFLKTHLTSYLSRAKCATKSTLSTFFFCLTLLCKTHPCLAALTHDIKTVDFNNFIYQPDCLPDTVHQISVKNGEFRVAHANDDFYDAFYFTIKIEAYGDIDGDGQDEAVIVSVCNTGGTGQFSEGFVYKLKSGAPQLLARIEGGDRVFGSIRSIKLSQGILTVERLDPGQYGGANCCARAYVTTHYRWNGRALVQFGKTEKYPLYVDD